MAAERDQGIGSRSNGHRGVAPVLAEKAKRADDVVVTFVRERPIIAVCAALALGYMIGRVFTRLD